MTDETEREALYTEVERNLGALDIEFEPGMEPFIVRFADAILAAGFRRTATPHVVTTVEGLRDLPHGTHLRGALGQAYLVLDGGVFAAGRATACTDEALTLPATVLTPAIAPAIGPDDEALVEKVARLIAHSALDWTDYATGEHDHSPACSNWEAYTDDARAVLAEATS